MATTEKENEIISPLAVQDNDTSTLHPTSTSNEKVEEGGVIDSWYEEGDDNDESDDKYNWNTPVPLSREEAGSAEVRKLARALAPSLAAAEMLFQVPSDFDKDDDDNDDDENNADDDDLDFEVEALGASENLLRQELEMAEDFGHLFAFRSPKKGGNAMGEEDEEDEDDNSYYSDFNNEPNDTSDLTDGTTPIKADQEQYSSTPTENQLQEPPPRIEADVDDLDREEKLDRINDLPPIRIPPSPLSISQSPRSATHQRRDGSEEASLFATPSSVTLRRGIAPPIYYTAQHHAATLHLDRHVEGWYRIQLRDHALRTMSSDLHEFCLSVPDSKLRQWYAGFPRPPAIPMPAQISPDSKSTAKVSNIDKSVSAVRTVTIRIRPDVLCGAVMDAVFTSLTKELNATVTKRQGGHCQADVPPSIYMETDEQPLRYPGYRVEARLATSKLNAARYLILRAFHSKTKGESSSRTTLLLEPIDLQPAVHLREASALIQRMEMKGETSKRIHWNSGGENLTQQGIQDVVSAHLLDFHRPCRSVKEGFVTLPSLNNEDFLIIQSSWRMVETIWEEVESRGLVFSNLQQVPFGAFPSLRTLDVHYCSQIRIVSRESMTLDLLQSARDLEKFARESELACANMINLLQPAYEAYGIKSPSLPKPKPLTEYPLEFVLPQEACPPWGDQVQSALNEIQSWASNSNDDDKTLADLEDLSAMDIANAAVQLVMEAFQRQDDLEQSARLGRKNIQVIDRIAKMEAHEKLSIQTIQHCAAQSSKALAAANSFKLKSKGILEVPLLKWSVLVGNSTGTCTVTPNHILFSTQLIPVLGGTTNKLFNLRDVEFSIAESTPSPILSNLPETITIEKDGRPIYTFRPSMGSARLKSFLDVVKSVLNLSGTGTSLKNPISDSNG